MRFVTFIIGTIAIACAMYVVPIGVIVGGASFLVYAVIDSVMSPQRATQTERESVPQNQKGAGVEAAPSQGGRSSDFPSPKFAETQLRQASYVALRQQQNTLKLAISIKNTTAFHARITNLRCKFLLDPDIGPRDSVSARSPQVIFVRTGGSFEGEYTFYLDLSDAGRQRQWQAERAARGGSFSFFSLREFQCTYDTSLISAGPFGTIRNPATLKE